MFWCDRYNAIQKEKNDKFIIFISKQLMDKYNIFFTDLKQDEDNIDTDDGCIHYLHKITNEHYLYYDDDWYTEEEYLNLNESE